MLKGHKRGIHTGGNPISITREKVDKLEEGKEYRITELLQILNTSERTFRRYMEQGKITPKKKIGLAWIYTKDDFNI